MLNPKELKLELEKIGQKKKALMKKGLPIPENLSGIKLQYPIETAQPFLREMMKLGCRADYDTVTGQMLLSPKI